MISYHKSHRNLKTQLSILLFILGFSWPLASEAKYYNEESEKWLQQLDSVVAHRTMYNAQKRERIEKMQELSQYLKSEADIYEHNRQLYEECFTFDSELAMNLAEENLRIASKRKDTEGECEWKIRRSFILASTGQLMEAANVLERLPMTQTEETPHHLLLAYYSQMQYLYSHLQQYSWSRSLKEEYQKLGTLYNDSIHAIIQPGDPDYDWHEAWVDMYSPGLRESAEKLKNVVDTLPLNCRHDAMLAYALAKMYEEMSETDSYLQYIARSAIADVKSANQDIASLEELAQVLYNISRTEEGNSFIWPDRTRVQTLNRSYSYINVCLETSRIYNNLVRTVSIARVMDDILKAYQKRDEDQRTRLQFFLLIMSILLVIIIATAVVVWRQKRRLTQQREKLRESNQLINRQRTALEEANTALADANSHLTGANSALMEQNNLKEEYIGYVFAICSNYISKLDEYRKDINRKAKVKQWAEILAITEKQTILGNELKEFYHNFDTIFLHVYPTFIEEFNALLLPEEQIVARNGELLNTDLRIYALVRLGITDSTKIADFLHCSAQTVYNNRMKVRNKAIEKEHFTEQVRNLCISR